MWKLGLYNNVNWRMECPTCGMILTDFTTADNTHLPALHTVEAFAVNNFYRLCLNCGTFVEYRRKPATSIEDYFLILKPKPVKKEE